MATKSFLTPDEEAFAVRHFRAPNGLVYGGPQELGLACSHWLGERLKEKLEQIPNWSEALPVALGSWARDELCPKSDIDVIFCGPEDVVQEVVGQIQSRGLRLRSRLPQDPHDWTIGVEPFDILAILNGRALHPLTEVQLHTQKQRILDRGLQFAKLLLKAIENEKRVRSLRFDSVSNYLEPNIKYGPGGLRDLEQALAIRSLFPDLFSDQEPAAQIFRQYKSVWLAIRQRLHLMNCGDLLSGPEQPDLAKAFGFETLRDFMREFQNGISNVNFYANWTVAKVRKPRKKPEFLKTYNEALRALETDPSVLTREAVRSQLQNLKKPDDLVSFFKVQQQEVWFEALFDSHLLDHWILDLKRLRGLVQHDHYHRFTADAHLLQAIKHVVRAFRRPKMLGRLRPWIKELSKDDWQILLWTALFHDLAKGKGGDHAKRGGDLVDSSLKLLGVERDIIQEVKWMVQNHLLVSTAAFRMNGQEASTWQFLHQSGAVGLRLSRLAIFTALDILATNPEAWNSWKEQMLADLVKTVESPQAAQFIQLLANAKSALDQVLVSEIDPVVAQAVPARLLIQDLKKARRYRRDLEPFVLRNRRGQTWVRFHSREDRPGLFLKYVAQLFALGCSIQQSSVRTSEELGVYDWFQVKTSKRSPQILKQLDLIKNWESIEPPAVRLQNIEVVSQVESETILSFRGKDQKGVLLATAKALFELGYTIRWAKVLTWGSQIDDVFCVQGDVNLNQSLHILFERFHVQRSIPASGRADS